MVNVRPTRKVAPDEPRPLAATIASTVVPYRRARENSVSPFSTVWTRALCAAAGDTAPEARAVPTAAGWTVAGAVVGATGWLVAWALAWVAG